MAMRMSEEEYEDLQTKMASDKAEQEARENQNKPPETRTPQEAPGPVRRMMNKVSSVADVAITDITGKTKKERDLIAETRKIERESAAEKARDEAREEAKKPSSKKKSKKDDMEDMSEDDEDDEDIPRSKKKGSPVGVYESAYHHNKPMPYQSAYLPNKPTAYSETYTARKLPDNGVYKSPGNPRTYEHAPIRSPQPVVQRARAPMSMPTIGSFGNGNIKMPTISIGGYGPVPKVAGAHKMGPGNIPSINIPTLGSSTLMMGSGLMKKTANNKIGVNNFNIPTIGNWGKAPLKGKLETPNIGNLTIMGAGKGGVGFGLGEVPRFGLAAPVKRKK